MESYSYLLFLAIILLSTKVLGLASSKVKMPAVVGALLAGLILGPSVLGVVEETEFLTMTSEIGVIILMFMAGLETDLQELKETGLASLVIAVAGVIFPLVGGAAVYMVFFPNDGDALYMLRAIFLGVILTATSVSITVETLREMGKLKGKVGTAILGAAIIDDILGIVVLTVATSFTTPGVSIPVVLLKIVGFFVFLGVVGVFVAYRYFKHLSDAFIEHQHRRTAIYALVFCLLLSFIAEAAFGVADITGAFFAGLILCNIADVKSYVNRKMEILGYMFFSPIFFACVGLKTNLDGMTASLILFCIVLLIVAILTKIVGCGLGAKLTGFNGQDSVRIGVGMISRGEVALIVAQKGAAANLVSPELFPAVVLVVIVTTLITPILLKIVMADKNEKTA